MTNHSNISYCGINCEECPAFIAHLTNDDALREKTAREWTTTRWPLTRDDIDCVGCKMMEGPHPGFVYECDLRTCGNERGVVTCAHCDRYEGCESIKEFTANAGEEARERLDRLRSELESK